MSDWHRQETYKGMITLSVEVLRSLILINGAAALALLTFLGHVEAARSLKLECPLLTFSVGVACAVLAALVAYVTQNVLYLEETEIAGSLPVKRTHHWFQYIALGLALASVASFMAGCTMAANALSQRI